MQKFSSVKCLFFFVVVLLSANLLVYKTDKLCISLLNLCFNLHDTLFSFKTFSYYFQNSSILIFFSKTSICFSILLTFYQVLAIKLDFIFYYTFFFTVGPFSSSLLSLKKEHIFGLIPTIFHYFTSSPPIII